MKKHTPDKKKNASVHQSKKSKRGIRTFEEARLHGCSKEIRYVIAGTCWKCVSHHFKKLPENKGYVCLHRNAKPIPLHRYIWQKANQRFLKPGEIILWSCGNPRCMNPAHLVLESKAKLVGYFRRKLTMEQAEEIRLQASVGVKQLALAIEYNVCQATIANIVANKTYRRSESVPVDQAA